MANFWQLVKYWLGLGPSPPITFGGRARSPQWPAVEKAHLKKEPVCQVCGHNKQLNVHHIKPYHLFPELELDPDNLITLCNYSEHHLWFGHFGNFEQGYNLGVRDDATYFRGKMAKRSQGGV